MLSSRGKGLARRLIDYVCHNFVDVYCEDDDDDVDVDGMSGSQQGSGLFQKNNNTNEDSLLDSEIQSYNFAFDLDTDNVTDYSGYSSYSDSDVSSAHSSWYYKEDDDILAQYDYMKSHGRKTGALIYLESSHPRNRKIYQKLGFTFVKTVEVAKVLDKNGQPKSLTVDLMVRGINGAKWFQRDESRVI
ncbi:unnamed protein product [Ambrosiozyma monospora]|uniref:Unnamed protein product n=1 Tax=Ambrosiozyma monospora TaxID=43982 RepID=A0A9W7DPH1_AMBMO|nr:unnamed protein product [Ambrosiozyma monospora]